MNIDELLAKQQTDPDVGVLSVSKADLLEFGAIVRTIASENGNTESVIVEHIDDNAATIVLAEWAWGDDSGEHYSIEAHTRVYIGFEWRHLYFVGQGDGYMYYPNGRALIAFIEHATSHLPEAERLPRPATETPS